MKVAFAVALALLAGDASPPQPIAWVHAGDVADAVTSVEESRFGPVLALFGPADQVKAAREHGGALWAATFPTAGDYGLSLEAGPAADGLVGALVAALARQGSTAAKPEKVGEVSLRALAKGGVVFSGGGRIGIAAARERALDFAARPRLAESAAVEEVRALVPDAQLVGSMDVARWYGVLARGPDASTMAANLTRAGLIDLRTVAFAAALADDDTVRSRADLNFGKPPEGLLGTFGSPLPPLASVRLADDELAILRIGVQPARAFWALSQLFSYNRPLDYGLVASQLMAVEQRLQKKLDLDVLGEAARVLTVRVLTGGVVAELEVADAAGARGFLDAAAEIIQGLDKSARVEKSTNGAYAVWVFRGRGALAVAAGDGRLWYAGTPELLRDAMKRKKPKVDAGDPVAGSLVVNDRAVGTLVFGASQMKALGALDRTRVILRKDGARLRLDGETTAAAPPR